MIGRLDHVRRLPVGWDGYAGRPVDPRIADTALDILAWVCDTDTPSPSLVPGASGDLQIEWHTANWDLEIDILRPGQVEAWRRNAASGIEDDIMLIDDFTEIREWVGQIAEPKIAARSAKV